MTNSNNGNAPVRGGAPSNAAPSLYQNASFFDSKPEDNMAAVKQDTSQQPMDFMASAGAMAGIH